MVEHQPLELRQIPRRQSIGGQPRDFFGKLSRSIDRLHPYSLLHRACPHSSRRSQMRTLSAAAGKEKSRRAIALALPARRAADTLAVLTLHGRTADVRRIPAETPARRRRGDERKSVGEGKRVSV